MTDRAAVFAAVAQAHAHFGRLDVIVSAAGYGLFGAIEEVSIEQVWSNVKTKLFGTLNVIQAALPLLRRQGSGHILPVTSIAGLVGVPNSGIYAATKFALEGLEAILSLVDAEEAPLRLMLGNALPFVRDVYAQRLTEWEAWDDVARAAQV